MTVSKLGATIKDARKAKGLTQEALAKEMHVSTGTISKWESGSNTPDIFKMQKLAQILDIPSTIFAIFFPPFFYFIIIFKNLYPFFP